MENTCTFFGALQDNCLCLQIENSTYKKRMYGGSMKGANDVNSTMKFKTILLKVNFFKATRLVKLIVHLHVFLNDFDRPQIENHFQNTKPVKTELLDIEK